jgi:hypothetical protein
MDKCDITNVRQYVKFIQHTILSPDIGKFSIQFTLK